MAAPGGHGPSLADAFFVGAALAFNSLTAPMTKLSQNAQGGYDFNKACIYFFAEVLKFVVSVGACVASWLAGGDAARFRVDAADVGRYAVPGFVFFVQNNLSFYALQHMPSAAFQLLLNTRTVAVAFLSVVLLNKRFNALEWTGVVLLATGATQFQLSSCDDGQTFQVSPEGMLYMIVIVGCAAGGNVATQHVMQNKRDQPLMLQNVLLYAWGIALNGANWAASMSGPNPKPPFGDLGPMQLASVVFYAMYGLSISVILKRFGALTRTLINTAAIVVTATIDAAFFGERITVLEATTFVVIFIAIFVNAVLGRHYGDALAAATEKAKAS